MKSRSKKNFFQRFWEAFWRPEMLVLPGQIAFFLFLSLVPTITLIGYACAYLNISNDLVQSLISNAFGNDISNLVTPIITATKITPAFFIALGVGYFLASNGMASIIVASNTIYGIKDSGFFKRRLKAIIMELVIVFLFLFILIVPVLGDSIIKLLHYFNLDTTTTATVISVFNFLSGPLSWIIIFLFIRTIYAMAPDKKLVGKHISGGAFFTTMAWGGITSLYSFYINNFANYSVFYGSLANIVVLMIWVYFLSYAFVIGMAMNYHQDLEKTGIIEISELIESSANSAPVLPEEEKKNNKKKKDKAEKDVEEIKEDKKSQEK